MKIYLALSTLILSMNAFALNCDLNVTVDERSGSMQEVLGKSKHESQYNAQGISEAAALKNCEELGGSNCKVVKGATTCIYNSNGSRVFRGLPFVNPTYTCEAIAKGTKKVEGKKLSAKEFQAKKKEAVCERLTRCENEVLNDSGASVTDLEKIDYLKNKNKCEEI